MNELITELIDGTMELVLHHHNISSPLSTTSEFQIPEKFILIYDESNGYEFMKENSTR